MHTYVSPPAKQKTKPLDSCPFSDFPWKTLAVQIVGRYEPHIPVSGLENICHKTRVTLHFFDSKSFGHMMKITKINKNIGADWVI